MRLFFVLIVIILGVSEINTWRIFHLGRQVGGNLGTPHSNQRIKEDEAAATVIEDCFTQKLDHSEPTDKTTWKQRYFVNNQYYNGSGVAFLMIGGEGEASIKWMTQGNWINYAQQFGALLFQLEHRYYGKSHPTDDMSTDNLKYLTSEQALSDLATFIVAMNKKYKLPTNVKWIAFGGSYPGSLAAWLRFKYPHLVQGAMSASGPLLAQADFKDYFRVVRESLATYSEDCPAQIQKAIQQVDSLIKTTEGQTKLNTIFKLCDKIEDSIDNQNDISNFYETLANNFAGVVQYNKDNRLSGVSKITIDVVCEVMLNTTIGDPVDRLGQVNKLLLESSDQSCLDYKYDKMINDMKSTSWSSSASEGGRQWTYQTCTEFGFYQTSANLPQIFGNQFPLSFYIQQCQDIFGDAYNANLLKSAIDRTNTNYGALRIDVSNVVFVHGSIDPWHALGITESNNPDAPAIYIEGTAHCANMYTSTDEDPPELIAAREQVGKLIGTWLQSPTFYERLQTPQVIQN